MGLRILPDRAKKEASISASVSGVPTPIAQKDEELRELMQGRLRIGLLIISLTLIGYTLSFASGLPRTSLLSLGAVTLGAFIPTFLLWRKKEWSLAALRWYELITLAYGFLGVIAVCMIRIRDIDSLPHLAPGLQPSSLMPFRLMLFSDGGLYTGNPQSLLCNPIILNASVFAVAYSVLMPSTWRRAVTIMICIVVTAVGLVAYIGLCHPAFRRGLGGALFYTGYTVAGFAAMGVYGSHRLNRLRSQVQAAQRIGQYVLKQLLGKGGMGEVYLAHHRMLRRPCAVKLIRTEKSADSSSLMRFEREVQAMAQLTHPNTVEIYDYGRTDEGMFYYAMEYLPGLSTEELVRQHGALHSARVIHILRQVCGALAEAHGAGMIHRDLKPANIFLCERGRVQDVVKLLDFGLVQLQGELSAPQAEAPAGAAAVHSSDEVKLTRAGLVLGTPAYLSPEQANGTTVDARSDIYSLGAVAYYLICGQPPFLRPTVLQMLAAHETEAPRPLSARCPQVDSDLASIIMRCLEKQPAQRYQAVQDLERALDGCQNARRWDAEAAMKWWQAVPTGQKPDSDPAHSDTAGNGLLTTDMA